MKNKFGKIFKSFLAGLVCLGAALFIKPNSTAEVNAAFQSASETNLGLLEKQFRELPMEARQHTGPLFWLHGDETRERLEMYVDKVAEGGNGCFTAESRPHNDWLGEGWYRDLGICLNEAKKQNLKMWIFDEKWWPSGEVGGKVPEQYRCKRLNATATKVIGSAAFADTGYSASNLVAVIAGRVAADSVDGASLIDLSNMIDEGMLRWTVPPGEWNVMKFTWSHSTTGRAVVDGASSDCVDWYVKTVYQPHFDHFKDDFGKNIIGYFYDEPETHGDWGTEVLKVLRERHVDWKKALVAWKFRLAGEEQPAARYQYQDAFAEAWGRTLYGGLSRWCHEHGVRSIGHFLEHAKEYLNPEECAGDMFQLQKYSEMGGIDAISTQFKPGQRVAANAPCWQTPKLGSSITHAYGKPDDVAMVEIFGARGQDLTYPEMKWWADHMQVSGVNFLIPHSFNPRAPYDNDCPPYFYDGGFEPRWPLYRVFADYTSRLNLMLTGGRHVCPVALLFLGNSAHVGKSVTPEQMSEALQDALYDCDWIPYEVFENDITLNTKEMKLRNESYRVLIVPPVEVIPYATLAKAKQFFDDGGIVLGYGLLPTKSAMLGKTSEDITRLRDGIWGPSKIGLSVSQTNAAGGRSYFLPEEPTPEQLQTILSNDAGVHPALEVVEGRTDHWLHVLHRVKEHRDVFLICNQNHLGDARTFRFKITAEGEPECWDPLRNEITAAPFTREGNQVVLTMTFEPLESILLVFAPTHSSLPVRISNDVSRVRDSILVVRDPTPVQSGPVLKTKSKPSRFLDGCSWIWYPEGNPTLSAPAGTRYFRKQIDLPAGRKIIKAAFVGSADNGAVLFINGKDAGHSDESDEGWRNPVELDVTKFLKSGLNQLAISVVNATDEPSPAGLIGKLVVELEGAESLVVRLDKTWKTSNVKQDGWRKSDFKDNTWASAKEVAAFGGNPWGRLNEMLTLSPVKADPFFGHFEMPSTPGVAKSHVYLEMDELNPEAAARVTINDVYAGGFIGRPYRLEITGHLKTGTNSIRIEPFSPHSVSILIHE